MPVRLLELPKILDARGNLSVVEEEATVPFTIRRIYWIYDVPGGQVRGSHAFRATEEIIIALSGSFDVVLHDGHAETVRPLNRSYVGLYVPAMTWRTLENFSTNSTALVLASTPYDEADYVRDFAAFAELARRGDPGRRPDDGL